MASLVETCGCSFGLPVPTNVGEWEVMSVLEVAVKYVVRDVQENGGPGSEKKSR
jgi:hypothetical protein